MEYNFDLGVDDPGAFVRASRSFTLADQLRKTVRMYGDRVAVSEPGRELTYAELDERSDRLADALVARGVEPESSTVAVCSENRGETVTLAFACAKLGCALATLNWRLERPGLVHCFDLADPDVLVVSNRFVDRAEWFAADAEADPLVVGYDGPGTLNERDDGGDEASGESDGIDPDYDHVFADLVAEGEVGTSVATANRDPELAFAVLNTSGTTGLPKGVAVSHRAILSRIATISIDYELERGDGYPAWGPMFHPAGVTWIGVTAALGGTFYPIDGFDPERIVDVLLETEQPVSWLFLVPGVVDRLLDHVDERGPDPDEFPTIRTMGALPDMIDPELIERVTETFGAPFQNTYGAAENGHVASGNKIPIGVAPDAETLRKHESPFVAVRAISEVGEEIDLQTLRRDDESDADPQGELLVRGPLLASGYVGNEAANVESYDDGWFLTGDVFDIHDDGTYSFVSRRKYLIKPGGENVYPAEMESILAEHEAVEEVIVVRTDDPEWGEVPRVVVGATPEDSDQLRSELLAMLDGKLARYKLPHYISIVDPVRFDRSATGKIVRTEVEEWPIDEEDRVRGS